MLSYGQSGDKIVSNFNNAIQFNFFVVGPCGFFWPYLCKCIQPPNGHFVSFFDKNLAQGYMIINKMEVDYKNHNLKSFYNRIVMFLKTGDYESGIETLVGAISLIKQSPTAGEERCQVRQTLKTLEPEYGVFSVSPVGLK